MQLASYGEAKIFKLEGKPLLFYFVPVIKPTRGEKNIINTIKEAATRIISIAPYKIRDPEQRRNAYKQRILEILRASKELNIPERRFEFYAEAVVREMVGYGIIDSLIRDDKLEEIMVIGAKKPVYVFHREYEMMLTNIEFFNEGEIVDLINRIGREVGRRIDISSPLLDARLLDGSRVNATIPPASISGASLTIRKFREDPYSIVDLINFGTLDAHTAAFLWVCVEGLGAKPANILISGGTGSGKTTTLNVMASFIPPTERIVTIEDTAELSLALTHFVSFEARPPGLEGTGELTMDILTKNSLRMRPDRIIVGEVRHAEAFTLFTALNTGHDGALTGETKIQLSNGNIEEIGKIAEKEFKKNNVRTEKGFEFVEVQGLKVKSLNKQILKIEDKTVSRIWRKQNSEEMIEIKTKSGKKITTTQNHPFYKINEGIMEINAGNLQSGDFIAMPNEIIIDSENETENAYLAGLILGDGHLRNEFVSFVNTEQSILDAFHNEISNLTQNTVGIVERPGATVIQLWDKKLCNSLHENFEIPFGNKTKSFNIPSNVLASNSIDCGEFIKGLYDCEAHVNKITNSIEFSTSNQNLASTLPLMLLRFGIISRTGSQEKDGRGNIGPYYKVTIYGKYNLQKFNEFIGFKHEKKKQKLEEIIKSSGNSYDLVPSISQLLKKARKENNLSRKQLGKKLGLSTGSVIQSIENGKRNPNKKTLQKILNQLNGKTAIQLKMLAEADVYWDKIVSIKKIKKEEFVYDLTVENNHTYIANGFHISNCMGTIHANSPAETIVRVTSPPMSVPEVMLSGLDFIIVEHRIHDKKKGTIRRITEIAEVSGTLDGKTQTNSLFERDAVSDRLIFNANYPSRYLKELQKFTGLTKKQIDDELSERAQLLNMLVKKGIRDLPRVSQIVQQYITEKRGQ